MKKIFYIALLSLTFAGCADNLVDMNQDVKNPKDVPAEALIANSIRSLFEFMTSPNVNVNTLRLWSQHWAQTQYPDESNYQLVERNVNGAAWDRLYAGVIKDARQARPVIEADKFLTDEQKRNQLAILTIVEVTAYSILVDIFGDAVYTDAFSDDLTPAYDNDEDIYTDLFKRLDEAMVQLEGESGLFSADLAYNGDTQAWERFANSWKLKMAVRIADQNPAAAQTHAEAAITAGVFTSTAHNFTMTFDGSPPHANPLWEALVQSGRTDFVASSTLGDILNNLNDPRSKTFFRNLEADGSVTGGTPGATNSYSGSTQPGDRLENASLEGVIMDYAQVQFLLADVAERGWAAGGTAESFYNEGVTASILYWGGTSTEVSDYLAQADVAYTTAAGTWKEKIGTQKYIALYNQGFEAWSNYRLYDAPEMQIATSAGTTPPLRFTYPVVEYSVNRVNVQEAASAIGGDAPFTPVFWDVN